MKTFSDSNIIGNACYDLECLKLEKKMFLEVSVCRGYKEKYEDTVENLFFILCLL